MESAKILSISMGSVYTSDFSDAFKFYHDVLGLDEVSPMGDNACYISIGEGQGLYIEGGHDPLRGGAKASRTTFTFKVESASAMAAKLKKNAIKLIQAEPMNMGNDMYWFQCYDPTGNVVEFLGGE